MASAPLDLFPGRWSLQVVLVAVMMMLVTVPPSHAGRGVYETTADPDRDSRLDPVKTPAATSRLPPTTLAKETTATTAEPEPDQEPEATKNCSGGGGCYRGQCNDDPDLEVLYPGVCRTAEEYGKELPTGCTVSYTGEGENYGEVKCNKNADARYWTQSRRWLWGDGNCCCPAFRYLYCPNYIYVGGRRYYVAHWGLGAQCWTQTLCGIENGICQGRCVPQYQYRTVLVYDTWWWWHMRWLYYSYPSSCRCTTCETGYCTSGFFLGDGRD